MTGAGLRIGEAAALAGVSPRTLRYYEELGLLTPPGRTPGGARRYGEADLARLARIRELKDLLGFNLDEVGTVLEAEDRLGSLRAAWFEGTEPARHREILSEALAINTRLQAAVGEKLERIGAFQAELEARAGRYRELLGGLEAPAGRQGQAARGR